MNQEELKQRLIELYEECMILWHDNASISTIVDHLIANGVTIRERGEWIFHKDGSATCKLCGRTQKNVWDNDNWQNFCGCCGADLLGGKDE